MVLINESCFSVYAVGGSQPGGPGDPDKKRSLAELFKPPTELMFHGTFQEVNALVLYNVILANSSYS